MHRSHRQEQPGQIRAGRLGCTVMGCGVAGILLKRLLQVSLPVSSKRVSQLRLLGCAESNFLQIKEPWIINPPLDYVLSLDERSNNRGLARNSDALLTAVHAHWL